MEKEKQVVPENDILVAQTKLAMAYCNYQKIIDKKLPHKFRYLEEWLYNKSYQLLYEVDNPNRIHNRFKRGSVVRLDFGVNIGGEFSQQHFAIIISKQDDIYNDLISVIPLTSKEHKGKTIPLDDLIVRTFLKNNFKEIDRIKLEQKSINKELKSLSLELHSSSVFGEHECSKYKKKINGLKERISSIDEQLFQMEKISSIYSKYTDLSYACVNQIKVVSKARILKPINEYDIVGRQICSQELMAKLDNEVIKRYTGIDFPAMVKILEQLELDKEKKE